MHDFAFLATITPAQADTFCFPFSPLNAELLHPDTFHCAGLIQTISYGWSAC